MSQRPALRLAMDPEASPTLIRPSVTVATAASRLETEGSAIRRLIRSGALQGHRMGKRGVRIYVDSIEAYQRGRPLDATPGAPAPGKARQPHRTAAHREAVALLASLHLV